MRKASVIFLSLFVLLGFQKTEDVIYSVTQSNVHFTSDAPLELIEATSTALKGLLKPAEKTFAFSIPMKSFDGFNSPLQREHFNENYIESDDYPMATFSGKIIVDIDFSAPGTHTIRAKGKLNIHGVSQERIIKAQVMIEKGKINITSDFSVLLKEHNISIPRIVHQKIAEEIKVKLEAELEMKQ